VARSRVAEVVRAMQGAREFTQIQVAGKTLLCLANRGEEVSELSSIGSAREKETDAAEKLRNADLKFQKKREAEKLRQGRRKVSSGQRVENKFAPKRSEGKKFDKNKRPFSKKNFAASRRSHP